MESRFFKNIVTYHTTNCLSNWSLARKNLKTLKQAYTQTREVMGKSWPDIIDDKSRVASDSNDTVIIHLHSRSSLPTYSIDLMISWFCSRKLQPIPSNWFIYIQNSSFVSRLCQVFCQEKLIDKPTDGYLVVAFLVTLIFSRCVHSHQSEVNYLNSRLQLTFSLLLPRSSSSSSPISQDTLWLSHHQRGGDLEKRFVDSLSSHNQVVKRQSQTQERRQSLIQEENPNKTSLILSSSPPTFLFGARTHHWKLFQLQSRLGDWLAPK